MNALAALDGHPGLGVLTDATLDGAWVQGEAAMVDEMERASRYLELLDEEEQKRRIEEASNSLHPDDWYSTDLQSCPVCLHETLIAQSDDLYGNGVAAGTCFVCSYHQSEHEALALNQRIEFERKWAND